MPDSQEACRPVPSSPPRALRLVDLFAGCGGLTSGFTATGRYRTVAAVENDLAAAATYAVNFGEDHIHWGDIESWLRDLDTPPVADVVIGGPPCQGFSNLGARRSNDKRNELWRRYVDALVAIRPQAFLLENVDRFATSPQYGQLERTTGPGGRLSDYRIDLHVVRAVDFGSAQLRRRAIAIGTHRDLPQILVPRTRMPMNQWRTVADAFDALDPGIDPDHCDLPESKIEVFETLVPGAFKASDLHLTRRYTDLSLRRFQSIPLGGNRLNLPDELKARCWIGHDKGSFDVMGRMYMDKPSVTIRTEFFKPEKGRYIHPTQDRAISHREAARLQGFSDDFQWCGTKLAIARQIGNAVPVELATGLAAHLTEGVS